MSRNIRLLIIFSILPILALIEWVLSFSIGFIVISMILLYTNKNKNINIIVSSGQGKDEVITETLAMKKYMVKNGIREDVIILEDKANTTLENIIF